MDNERVRAAMREWIATETSDLHVKANNPPLMRRHGDLVALPSFDKLTATDAEHFALCLLGHERYEAFRAAHEMDVAIDWEGRRIRVNAHVHQGGVGLSLRLLPERFIDTEDLGLPDEVVDSICALRQGLVLVTGATGSGKSTTLASLIHRINGLYPRHIVTIEDPVEYRHASRKSLVTQREVGADTASFPEALRRVLREDPDVVLIGEMRDRETMSAALTLAETGHLTFATLHTSDSVQTVSRIISSFPANEQEEVRTQLAMVLRYVLSQQLVPWSSGKGRSLAAEIMVVNSAIRSMIRDNKLQQIAGVLQTGGKLNMRTMNMALRQLVRSGKVDEKTAVQFSADRDDFARCG
jgi:twitching motility protein PilT